jgi:hypothetical protein
MRFSAEVRDAVIRIAEREGIDPAGLLAVVEVESAGKPLEDNNRTPRFLFERHIFYRYLRDHAPQKLQRAVELGLAHPRWDRTIQYKDQATSKGRRSLLGRAVRIDEEGAHYSASWGVGQIMGFHAKDIGFRSAVEMVRYMEKGGLVAQIEIMVRMIKKHNLVRFINSRRWASFAKAYNGSGYRANRYDTKLAAAFQRWETEMA